MKLPWKRNKAAAVSDAVLRERAETERTRRELEALQARTPQIAALSDRMVEYRIRNHFGESLTLAMMPKPGKERPRDT